jgi:two-component system, cell cycle sensor histidine kinase and response regulator CckA
MKEEKHFSENQFTQPQNLEAVATLAGGIAHQFNNALVGIAGSIELLALDLPMNRAIEKHLEPMKSSLLRMTHLTDQLLAYAQGGKYQPKSVSIADVVQETLPSILQNIQASILVETRLHGDIPEVIADRTQIRMVISAVISNAAEAIEGAGRIRITTEKANIDKNHDKYPPYIKTGPYVSLQIEDDGKGMNEEIRSRIFEPFFSTKFQGRGLGMAAVYGIIKNHHGWISVDSSPGQGTQINIFLPAKNGSSEQ